MKRSKKQLVAIKLYIEKAYDTHGNFLINAFWIWVFHHFFLIDYHLFFSDWITTCVSKVKCRIQINGKLSSQFSTQRGLNVTLFLPICLFWAEKPSQELTKNLDKNQENLFQKISPGEAIPLLQFAGILIFASISNKALNFINDILHFSHQQAGKKININKSQLLLPDLLLDHLRDWLSDSLRIQNKVLTITYLGAQSSINRTSSSIWTTVIKKLKSKITNWKGSVLSHAGRHVLIQSVCSTLPNYWLPRKHILTKQKLKFKVIWISFYGQENLV